MNKILRKAVTEASRIVKTAVKGNADATQRFGFLAKSIGVKVKTYKGVAVAVVGPRSKWSKTKGVYVKGKHKGEAKMFKPSKYAHLIEKGTKRSQAHPFLKPALDSTGDQYLNMLSAAIERQIALQLQKQ